MPHEKSVKSCECLDQRWDLINACKYLVGKRSEEDRGNLLLVLPTERPRGNGQ